MKRNQKKTKENHPHQGCNIRDFKRSFVILGLSLTLSIIPSSYTLGSITDTSTLLSDNQTIKLGGNVVDESGEPMIGVAILVKGTAVGTVTDMNGNFTLDVSAESTTLIISYLGYKTQHIPIAKKSEFKIKMEPDTQNIDEVVVIGYGTQRKVDLTGSVTSVNKDVIKAVPVTTAAEAITGKLAGVQVIKGDGSPDAEIKIRIRGGGSITQDNSPLYILDGFPVENGLSLVAPQDIERIDVLKDASSTAIYGARGANGVVIITTKGGTGQRTSVSYDGYVGFKSLAQKLDVMNPLEFVQSVYERYRVTAPSLQDKDMADMISRYGGWDSYSSVYGNVKGEDWQERVTRTAFTQVHNISLNGGNQSTKYNVGVSRTSDEGIIINSKYERTQFNLKLNHEVDKHLSFGVSARYNNNITSGGGSRDIEPGKADNNPMLLNGLQYRPVTGPNGEAIEDTDYDEDYVTNIGVMNPVLIANETYRKKTAYNANFSGEIAYKLGDFTWKVQGGVDRYNTRNESFYGAHMPKSKDNGGPWARLIQADTKKWINTNTLHWEKRNIQGKHNISAIIGHEWMGTMMKSTTITAYKFPSYITAEKALGSLSLAENPQKPESLETPSEMVSFFGRVNYDYASRYLFNATLRTDGSSKFSKENRWGVFPSLGAAWRINEEGFMSGCKAISNLKLRYSFGIAGNDRIESLLWTNTWMTDQYTNYGLNNQLSTALKSPNIANPNIKWEKTLSNNVGIDLGLWNNRVNISTEYYVNTTKDLLLASNIAMNSGYSTQIQNIGSTRNQGIEITLDAVLLSTKDFQWAFGMNLSHNRNKVLDLNDGEDFFYQSTGITTAGPTNDYIVRVGESVGQMYGYVYNGWYTAADFSGYDSNKRTWTLKEGVSYLQGSSPQPGDIKYERFGEAVDSKGNPIITEDDRQVIGNANPTLFGGFHTTMNYKGIDFSAYFTYSIGNDVYNANNYNLMSGTKKETNMLKKMAGRYTLIDEKGEPITDVSTLDKRNVNATTYAPFRGNHMMQSDLVEDGSFLRLSNVTLGYTLPKAWTAKFKVQNLRLYTTAYNLFCLTKYSGYDPEVNCWTVTSLTPSVDYAAYPQSKSYIFGLNITF